MNTVHNILASYEDWMERRPTQALVVHVSIYLAVSTVIIGIGLAVSQ